MERPVFVVLVMLVLAAMADGATQHHHPPSIAPAPAVDCSNAVLGLADCLSYVQKGSNTTKPEKACCKGLKGLVKAGEVNCLCEAFKSSASLGISLDFNKALGLPTACGVSTPPFSDCGISGITGGAPAPSPISGQVGVGGVPAVSPNSQSGGASSLQIASAVLLICTSIIASSLHFLN
ncbi:Non-specific lipid-transfer protein-like protein [Acorus calamus]|uniref:Non-specific lipid-transfer protein-like protein n=1 Tax=Acorus calamus TaxID=4465 RepID=A0AAV9DM47_ACOCL|nr:Non-specific lipid-transfer protein-like protein [Acorus calamus]